MVTAEQQPIAAVGDRFDRRRRDRRGVGRARRRCPTPKFRRSRSSSSASCATSPGDGGRLRIEVTPTYSGCPATEMIAHADPRAARRHRRARRRSRAAAVAAVDHRLDRARSEGQARGVRHRAAARVRRTHRRRRDQPAAARDHGVPCPRCGSAQTKLLSQFGSTACKAQYRCTAVASRSTISSPTDWVEHDILSVIPAKAGIQRLTPLGPRLRGDDGSFAGGATQLVNLQQ